MPEHLILTKYRSNGVDCVRIEHYSRDGKTVGEPVKVETKRIEDAVVEWAARHPERLVHAPSRAGTFLTRYPVTVRETAVAR